MTEGVEEKGLVPKLRFPEFQDQWKPRKLGDFAIAVTENVGDRKFTPVSISAGRGFVLQAEKFGRDISGEQYRRYTLVSEGTFVYNRGNSILFPQGCVYRYFGANPIAAPAVFTCFRTEQGVIPGLLEQFFMANLHGSQLSRHITSGARSNGLLNISDRAFFSLHVPLPSEAEQRKIAECLQSLDELIAAETEKLKALKQHKKSLLQQLFPEAGETTPRLRFPQFRNAGEWRTSALEDVCEMSSGGTPSRSRKDYWNGTIPWVTTSLIQGNRIVRAEEFITELAVSETSAKLFPPETIVIAMYGQGKTRGKVAILGLPATTNQACAAILPNDAVGSEFLFFFQFFNAYERLRSLSNSGGQDNLSQTLIAQFEVGLPPDKEEQLAIASILNNVALLCSAQESAVASMRTQKAALMQQLFPSLDEVDV